MSYINTNRSPLHRRGSSIFTSSNFNIIISILYYIKLKGGSLKVKEIKAFLEASYMEKSPNEIMGYMLDEDLSFLYGKVYVNEQFKKVVFITSWNS